MFWYICTWNTLYLLASIWPFCIHLYPLSPHRIHFICRNPFQSHFSWTDVKNWGGGWVGVINCKPDSRENHSIHHWREVYFEGPWWIVLIHPNSIYISSCEGIHECWTIQYMLPWWRQTNISSLGSDRFQFKVGNSIWRHKCFDFSSFQENHS